MSPEQIAEQFIRSMQPKTPEEEAYADFLEGELRAHYRYSTCASLLRGYSQPLNPSGQRIHAFLNSLTDEQLRGVQEIVQDSARHARCGMLFTFKQLEVRNRQGVQLALEDGLQVDAHLEWLRLTDHICLREAVSGPQPDRLYHDDEAYIRRIEPTSWQRYLAPIIGLEPVDRFLKSRSDQPSNKITLVGEMEEWGDVVGFVSVALEKSDLADAEMTALHVLRFFRGRRLASAAGKAHENGARSLLMWTLADNAYTAEFCRKRGGEEVAEREAEYAPGFREIAFRWTDLERLRKQGELE